MASIEQFPETIGRAVEIMAADIEVCDALSYDKILEELLRKEYTYQDAESMATERCIKTFKTPKGFVLVTLIDEDTIYPVKLD